MTSKWTLTFIALGLVAVAVVIFEGLATCLLPLVW